MKRKTNLLIKRWLRGGTVEGDGLIDTVDELLVCAGRKLDHAYANDICGEILFQGSNGRYYVGSVEFVISPANPEYVKEVLQEEKEA